MTVLSEVANHWWALTIRGILAIVFGVLMFMMPGVTLTSLALVYGIFAVVEGIFSMGVGFTGGKGGRSGWAWFFAGLVSLLAGMIALFWPGMALLSFFYLLIAWAFLRGIIEIVTAISLRRDLEGEWAWILSGVVSILFALLLVGRPAVGLVTLAFMIGIFAVARGILEITASFRLRSVGRRLEEFR